MIGQQLAPTPIRLVDLGIPCQITRIQWNPSLIETLIHSLFIRVSFFYFPSYNYNGKGRDKAFF